MPVGFAKHAITNRGRPLSFMANLKRTIEEMQAEETCLVHALAIAIARLDKDPNYNSFQGGCSVRPVVETICKRTGMDLYNGA